MRYFARRNTPSQRFWPCWPSGLRRQRKTGQQRPYGLWYPSVPDRPRTSWRVWSPRDCNRNTPPARSSWRTSLVRAAISALTLSPRPRPMGPPSGSASALAINTLLFSRLPYDPRKDIEPVTQLVTQPSVLAVNPALGVNSVADFVALLRKNPA